MSTSAKTYIENHLYAKPTKEAVLRSTKNDDDLIKEIVEMANSESWPTGRFSEDDVQKVLEEHAMTYKDKTFFVPPTHETVIRLFRDGDIGGSTKKW